MKFAFMDANRNRSLKKMCEILDVSRSGYFQWRNRTPSSREIENEKLGAKIKKSFEENRGVYGSPRLTEELRDQGILVGENRVAQQMKILGISAEIEKKFKICTTTSDPNSHCSPNLLNRKFRAEEPNQIWVSDITYIETEEYIGFLCAIKDLFDESIIGWTFERHMQSEMVVEALRKAIFSRKPSKGLLFHSDQGSQYSSEMFRKELNAHNITQSMSRKGNCYDNAPMESFFARLKVEEVYRKKYRTFAQAKINLFDYIELFYNRKRRHSRLGYKPPIAIITSR